MIAFTGSTKVGVHVSRDAAPTVQRVSLALGGKSAYIVLLDADLQAAVEVAVAGVMSNSGETCAAHTRTLPLAPGSTPATRGRIGRQASRSSSAGRRSTALALASSSEHPLHHHINDRRPTTMSTTVALVTGGSSGIGEATARKLAAGGFTVYAAARRVQRMQPLTELGIRPLAMDITDDASIQAGVANIIDEQGRVDVLVNNAGYGSYGALEDVPMDEARAQMEVNVFGAARLTQLVLPHMRAQRSGTIVNVTSMGGKIYTPLGAWYHATKFALEAISDCLRMEVKPFGINVVVIEPGGIRTEWPGIAAEKVRAVSGTGPYAPQGNAVAQSLVSESTQRRSSPPELIAKTIAKTVTARRPKTRYAVGYGAKPIIFMHDVLPDRAFDALIRRATGVPS